MEPSKNKDYGEIAKKFNSLLKEGIGIAEILSMSRRNFKVLNKSNHSFDKKDN